MLTKSSVLCYKVRLILPPSNGKNSAYLADLQMKFFFAQLPVESIVYKQQAYYDVINCTYNLRESTPFLSFMLSAIQPSLLKEFGMIDEIKAHGRQIILPPNFYYFMEGVILNFDPYLFCAVSLITPFSLRDVIEMFFPFLHSLFNVRISDCGKLIPKTSVLFS